MIEKVYLNKLSHTDLNMHRCGIEDCKPSHFWGPAVRDHFLIHYILDGAGTFQVNGITYNLKSGEGFLICPNTISAYKADSKSPWSYCWVGFQGLKAASYLAQANLSVENPIFIYDKDDFLEDCVKQMVATEPSAKTAELRLLSLLYLFLSKLIEVTSKEYPVDKSENTIELYIKKGIEYIEMNYFRKMSVLELSKHLGLDRSYVYSIFKNFLNASPQEYIINFRMAKACELMSNSALSIGDISRSVGYDDPLLFSKIFKKSKGESPREFRKKI